MWFQVVCIFHTLTRNLQYRSLFLFTVIILSVPTLLEAQSLTGTSGLFHIPTARTQPDKSLMIGFHHLPVEYSLYGNDFNFGPGPHDNRFGYATITFLPRVELMFRYTYMMNANRGSEFAIFMDRMVAGRLLILRETEKWPSVLFGMHDPGDDAGVAANQYFGANYLVASKAMQFNSLISDLHLGYAFDLPKFRTQVYRGVFGGFSLSMEDYSWLEWMLEYDSSRWNTAAKVRILNRIQIMAGLMEFKRPAGGISYRFQF